MLIDMSSERINLFARKQTQKKLYKKEKEAIPNPLSFTERTKVTSNYNSGQQI